MSLFPESQPDRTKYYEKEEMTFPSLSAPFFVPEFPLDSNNSVFLRWTGGPIPQPGAVPNLWICS